MSVFLTRSSILLAGVGAAFAFGHQKAEAQACTTFTSSNDAHVTAGRASTSTSQSCSACVFGICGFPSGCDTTSTGYVAVGSGDSLGSSGSLVTTLYQTGSTYRTTAPASELSCSDRLDNDCDGKIDCADSQCASDPACATPTLSYVTVPAAAFVSYDPTTLNGGAPSPRSQSWRASAPLPLPDGALVKELRCGIAPAAPIAAGSTATIVTFGSTGQVAEVGEALQISSTAPFDFVSRVVAITRLPRYNARNSARVISLNLSFTTMPPPDQGYISACTVGYTL